jgi:hypothetical protein
VDKMNSQPKFSNASVGSDQPIEVPDNKQSSNASEEPQHHDEPVRSARPTPAADRTAHDDPPRHSRRYYDDSDDMIERVRRAREAFDRKANAFQGPDWPHYEKRVIVGQKKKEDMEPSLFQDDSGANQTSQTQSSVSTLPVEPDKTKE